MESKRKKKNQYHKTEMKLKIQNKHMVVRGQKGQGGKEIDKGIKRYKLPAAKASKQTNKKRVVGMKCRVCGV